MNTHVETFTSAVERMERRAAERDAARDIKLAERDAKLAERDTKLAERDAKLAERDAKLAERDAKLAERVAKLAERDAEQARRSLITSFAITGIILAALGVASGVIIAFG